MLSHRQQKIGKVPRPLKHVARHVVECRDGMLNGKMCRSFENCF